MRSSIACVRCRRSKVKCVNTGPNTTCRACEASNRECTYPQPVMPGAPRTGAASASINSMTGSGLGGAGTGNVDRLETPAKKAKPKKPSAGANAAATAATVNTPLYWKDCLSAQVLTQAVWQSIFDEFQRHHSPMLPFLHPPTFLNRLRASAAVTTGSSSGNSPPPEKPHSPLLLLGLLALTARHVQPLISHHAPALNTPTAVSEFYASALKYKFKDEPDGLTKASIEKVQALLMLCVHEWGQTRKQEAYMWLGMAITMTRSLGLSWVDEEPALAPAPYSPEPEPAEPMQFKRRKLDNGASNKATTSHVVEKEIRRRTFWAVFILDRAISSGRYFPSGVSSSDANRVQLPLDERGFMFGANTQTGFLRSESLLSLNQSEEPHEIASGERILGHVVKAMEIWGQVQLYTETINPQRMHSPESQYHRLSTILDSFVNSLPHQLEFSPTTLQVHLSTHSSSSYALLHTTLFLCRIMLERKNLPDLPFLSPYPVGPIDQRNANGPDYERFSSESAERYFAAVRDLVGLSSMLNEWNAQIESPFVLYALERAARAGIYAYNFPWMDTQGFLTGVSRTPNAEALGSGEDTRKAIEYIKALQTRWSYAKDCLAKLVEMHVCLADNTEKFLREDSNRGILQDKMARISPNHEERQKLFSMLMPPTSKPSNTVPAAHMRSMSSDVDTLLMAASGAVQEPVIAAGPNPWRAVNTVNAPLPPAPQQQPIHSVGGKPDGAGSLDALAGFAAQQGKIGNGKDMPYNRDVEMQDANVKKEDSIQKSDERRWVESGGGAGGGGGGTGGSVPTGGWVVGVGALEG